MTATSVLIADLACAWSSLRLAEAGFTAKPMADLRVAVIALEDVGDYGGPCPARVLTAAAHLTRTWLSAAPEVRAGRLFLAVDAAIDAAVSYCAGTEGEPVGRVVPLALHQRAGSAA